MSDHIASMANAKNHLTQYFIRTVGNKGFSESLRYGKFVAVIMKAGK